jgi:hypothetical protein
MKPTNIILSLLLAVSTHFAFAEHGERLHPPCDIGSFTVTCEKTVANKTHYSGWYVPPGQKAEYSFLEEDDRRDVICENSYSLDGTLGGSNKNCRYSCSPGWNTDFSTSLTKDNGFRSCTSSPNLSVSWIGPDGKTQRKVTFPIDKVTSYEIDTSWLFSSDQDISNKTKILRFERNAVSLSADQSLVIKLSSTSPNNLQFSAPQEISYSNDDKLPAINPSPLVNDVTPWSKSQTLEVVKRYYKPGRVFDVIIKVPSNTNQLPKKLFVDFGPSYYTDPANYENTNCKEKYDCNKTSFPNRNN